MYSDSSRMSLVQRRLFYAGLSLLIVVKIFAAVPLILDFRWFAFGDAGSYILLDQYVRQGLRLGVDVGYNYGFLPVLLQHMVFAFFGPGHWQFLTFLFADVVLIIVFWWLICHELGESWLKFVVLIGLSGLMTSRASDPLTPAHVLLELFLMYSLYFVLKGNLRLALVLAALGALSVPSLPLALSGVLSLVILWQWWRNPRKSLRNLAAQFAPAAVVYGGTVLLLTAWYGWKSVIRSLLPAGGLIHYRAMQYGFFSSAKYGGRRFWDPPGAHLSYYLGHKAGIWLFCSFLLLGFGVSAAIRVFRSTTLPWRSLFVLLCCILHLVFVFRGFGGPFSSVYYESMLAAGVFAGFSALENRRAKIVISSAILVLGVLGQKSETQRELEAWRWQPNSAVNAFLFVPQDYEKEWRDVLTLASNHSLFLLAYGNGVSHYYPQIHTAESWFLLPGIASPRENAFVLDKLQTSDVVVEARFGVTDYIDSNAEWQAALAQFPVKVTGKYFRIWMKNEVSNANLPPGQ
jgi:hypothetical protein